MPTSKRAKKPEVKLPPGPNPAASRPMHVAPFGKAWALVEGLGVISTHKLREEAEAELARRQGESH